jgi:hypothetical protein
MIADGIKPSSTEAAAPAIVATFSGRAGFGFEPESELSV